MPSKIPSLFVAGFLSAFSVSAFSGTLVEDLEAEAASQNVEVVASSPYATGGDLILKLGDAEYVHVFVTETTFTPGMSDLVGHALLIGGGGGAGKGSKNGSWTFYTAGGGGGGGVLERTELGFFSGTTYTATIGPGGAGATSASVRGENGGTTTLAGEGLSLSVLGGGGGGSASADAWNGRTAATGGGAAGTAAGLGKPGNGSAHGKAGGTATQDGSNVNGGGGGGAGGAGAAGIHEATSKKVCTGGAGYETDIFGFPFSVAGGGASGSHSVNGGGTYGTFGQAGGGSNSVDSYNDGNCWSQDGSAGYGGGGAGPISTGGGSFGNGQAGGCGAVVIRYTVALNPLCHHQWDAGVTNVAQTCTRDGEVLHVCALCSEEWLEVLPAPGHQYDEQTGHCTVCGKCMECSYDEGTVTKDPTCTEEGIRTYVCSICGLSEEEELDPLGHEYVDGYCVRCDHQEDEPTEAGEDFLATLAASSHRVESVINAEGADIVLRHANADGSADYTLVFTNAATFILYGSITNAEILAVGGGGGGARRGGGGGAGGVVLETGYTLPLGIYAVTVGVGGGGGTAVSVAENGGATSLGTAMVAEGGGAGGADGYNTATDGQAGGSGGGGARASAGGALTLPGEGSQGHAGGVSSAAVYGGGGGAGSVGGAGSDGGHGGDGIGFSFVGGYRYFAGGGGGGSMNGSDNKSLGGKGGGGNGSQGFNDIGHPGIHGLGGGGGGGGGNSNSSFKDGGSGGSGILLVNYTLTDAELHPTKPPVNFQSCVPTGETTVSFTWLLRGFGKEATSAQIAVDWGTDPDDPDQTTILDPNAAIGIGSSELENLLPGRTYTFRLYALNDRNVRGEAEAVFTVTMPGGKSAWKECSAAQNKANGLIVDFEATIGSIGENLSTVAFRWKFGNGAWQEETLGTFDAADPPPSSYKVQKMFLDYDVVSYAFVVSNAAADISWSDVAEGRIAMSDGRINESYWSTKELGFTPVLNSSKTKTITMAKSGLPREYNYYTHNQDPAWGDTYTGTDTFIVGKPTDGDAEGRPLCVFLHGRGGSAEGISNDFIGENGVYNAPDDAYCIFLDNGRGFSAQDLSFPYWWGATGHWRGPEVGDVAGMRQEPATAKRVLDCVEWAARTFKVDRDRIYMAGNSMGGQGTLAIGLPHGEVFAAIEGNVPATVWYISARMNFVDDAGVVRNAEDRDATAYVDPPPCFDWSGSNDGWSRNHEVLLEAMNRFHYNYSVLWGEYGHCGTISDARARNDLVGRYDWKWIRKNAAYPCFSNATGNDLPPWPWATATYAKNAYFYDDIQVSGITYAEGAPADGQRNAWFRWENVSDTAEAMRMNLWVATAEEVGTTIVAPESQTADVTIRRVQGFKLLKDQPCAWSFGGASGTATANAEGVVTVNLTITHEKQELVLSPLPFDYLVAKASVCTVGEREVSVIANVQALGGADSATITASYRATGEAEWTDVELGTQGEGPALYTIEGLAPNVPYALKVTIDNGQDDPIVTDLGTVTTLYYELTASVSLGTVTETSVAVEVDIGEVGTLATEAAIEIRYRADAATSWTTLDCGTQKRGRTVYAIDGLFAATKYWVKATVDNGVDEEAEFFLGSVVTAYGGGKTLVEPPTIRDVKATGSAVSATVPASDLWSVVANAGGTAAGRYTVTLQLTDSTAYRWIGSDTATIELAYNIVETIPGLSLSEDVEWFSEKGDVVLILREGTDREIEIAYDAYADLLLVAGGGPGGWGSTFQTGLPGAGGGAGGMLEETGITLPGGTYSITVGAGGEPTTNGTKVNNKGDNSTLVGAAASFTAYGGGGGGHAVTGSNQGSALPCGVNGGSSGGSLLNSSWGYYPSIGADACMLMFVAGQGNYGGRISTGSSAFWVGSVGGGGAGEPAPWADTKNPSGTEFLPGGAGRASSITGERIVYATGGDGGTIATTAEGREAKNGTDGLGDGGAGSSIGSGAVGEPGRGGDGIVVIRLREYFLSGCAHVHTRVSQAGTAPTCTEGGFTDEVVCDDCGQILTKRTVLAALGHHYENDYCTVCGEESRFSKLNKLYWSNDRRYVFVDAHRGMTNEVAGIPHSSAAAFRYAIEIGADIIELDPKPTADGVIIVMHDANMEPEVYGPVSGIVGSGATANWAGQIENYILRKGPNTNEPSDQHVLTMAEALDICKDQCFLQIDCNYWTINQRMDQLWDLICEKGMQRQCIFIKDNLRDWPRYQQMGAPEGMVLRNDDRWDGGTLNQNQPDGFNDRSSFPDPTKYGWQRVMDQGSTVIMTDTAEALIGYLDTLGRHTLEPETDTRRMVTPLIPKDLCIVPGHATVYGAADTSDYVVVEDAGGSAEGESYVKLRLRDPDTTRWTDASDGDKRMWYHIREYDAATISGYPTDYADQTAEYPTTGSTNGLSWANAERAYAIGDETVLIFADPAAATSFTVLDGYDASGRYLLVGGGGPGGMNGTYKMSLAGAGGGAGGMLEGTISNESPISSGIYRVTVGPGGTAEMNHGAANNKGGDSSIETVSTPGFHVVAKGGGGGGHASTATGQQTGARGVDGGSSGGSLFYYNDASYGSVPSINVDEWNASYEPGQGNAGGRVGGYVGGTMRNSTVGGGGAAEAAPSPSADNFFGGGGTGRSSDITGETVFYAGGGAGGAIVSVSTQKVLGGMGGGGSTDFARTEFSEPGVRMLGGGGAGASYKNGTTDVPGDGGSGVVIVRLTATPNGDCTHEHVFVTKAAKAATCTEAGWTAETTCDNCRKVLEESVSIPALGHDFSVEIERVVPTATHAGHVTHRCSRCEETQVTEIPPIAPETAERPTDRPSGATVVSDGDVEGIRWSGAAAAWQYEGSTIIVFTNAAACGSIEVSDGFSAVGDVLAVGGGGSGGSGTGAGTWGATSGAGGSAGAMVELFDQSFPTGVYTITVGAGGMAADGGASSVSNSSVSIVIAEGGAAATADGVTQYGGWGGDGAGETGHRPLGSEPSEDNWLGGDGGTGRVSYVTGCLVVYAGGGAGGSVGYQDRKETFGGAGGGGGTLEDWGSVRSDDGIDGLGAGGAGACGSSGGSVYAVSEPGRGGCGVVVVRLTRISGSEPAIDPIRDKPTFATDGTALVADPAHETFSVKIDNARAGLRYAVFTAATLTGDFTAETVSGPYDGTDGVLTLSVSMPASQPSKFIRVVVFVGDDIHVGDSLLELLSTP